MTSLAWLIPAALFLGLLGLAAFLWALKNGQFEDLEGAGWRAIDDQPPGPQGHKPTQANNSLQGSKKNPE